MARSLAGIYATAISAIGALMRLLVYSFGWLNLFVASMALAACPPWPEHQPDALRALSTCLEPPVQRQIGNLCVRHEWRCGKTTFKHWFEHWMAEANEPFVVEKRLGQFIFSGQQGDTAWAVFWGPEGEAAQGFVILVSRMRASSSTEKF